MGSMMYGGRAGTGYAPSSGSLENSPNDQASVSAFHVGALRAYWRSLYVGESNKGKHRVLVVDKKFCVERKEPERDKKPV
jgi:hypothetical protein